jgi:hypothetical protein
VERETEEEEEGAEKEKEEKEARRCGDREQWQRECAHASGERAHARRELVAAVHATTSYSPAAAAATRPPAVAAAAEVEATGPEHEAVI